MLLERLGKKHTKSLDKPDKKKRTCNLQLDEVVKFCCQIHSYKKLRVFSTEAFRSQLLLFNRSFGWNPRNFRVSLSKPEVFLNGIFKMLTYHLTLSKFEIFSLESASCLVHWFTDSIRNQHPEVRVMDFARYFQGPKLQVWQKLPKLIPKFRLSGNWRISEVSGENEWLCNFICAPNSESIETFLIYT
jgi:hypothetical protein